MTDEPPEDPTWLFKKQAKKNKEMLTGKDEVGGLYLDVLLLKRDMKRLLWGLGIAYVAFVGVVVERIMNHG